MKPPQLTRRRARDLASLSRKKGREEQGEYLIEGLRSVESAVEAGAPLSEIVVSETVTEHERFAQLAARADVPILVTEEHVLRRIADTTTPQGVIAVGKVRWADPASMEGPLVVLDGVQDPGNVGAIVRSAAWFGVSGVIMGPRTADPFGPKAVRAAMGGLWDVHVANSSDLAETLEALRRAGYIVVGADTDGQPVSEWHPEFNTAMVMGSEAHGLSTSVRKLLDRRVTIAGGGRGVESLNVSIAAGILFHRWLSK